MQFITTKDTQTHFRGRGLGVPLPAASRLAPLFLTLGCFSVGLRALRALRLRHLALLRAPFWSSLLVVFSLIRRRARAERSVQGKRNYFINPVFVSFRDRKSKHQVTFCMGARICAVAVAAFGHSRQFHF